MELVAPDIGPINSLSELKEYANSPAPNALDGAAAELLLLILIVCAIILSY
jgi:hypothetical protein